MTDQVLRMTTEHLIRWTIFYGVLLAIWTSWVLTATSQGMRVIGVALGLLALRGLVGSVVAFGRRPTLILGPDALTVIDVVRSRVVPWAALSDFRPTRSMFSGHVRYQEGPRRRSLPAGFGNTDRGLSANELADVLNSARA